MRKFTLSIFLCAILCGGLSAQSETTSRSGFFDNILHAIPMSDGNIAVLNQRYLIHSELYIMDGEDLTQIFSFDLSSHIDVFEGMALGTDNSIFLIGSRGQCDYILEERSLIKIDLSGNGNGWVKTFDYTPSYNFEGFNNALQTGPDGGVWVANEVSGWQLSMLYDNQGNDIGNGGGYLGIYNDWNVATQEAVITASGDLLLFTHSLVRLYDSQLNLLHSTALDENPFGDIGVRPIVTSDSQYIYILNPGDSMKLMRMDYNLQIINEVNWNIGDDVKAMIAHNNDSLTIIGNDYHHIYAKKISNSFDFVETEPDVGIVQILNADIISPYCEGMCEYDIGNIEIVVQNFGTQPITSYEINAQYNNECHWFCNYIHVYETYNNLLLPGERDTVAFRDMQVCLYYEPEVDFCFYTTRPNAIVDKNQDNDRICADFEVFLPIELLTPLQAKTENRTALLTWETATETNNEGFEIQKSQDALNWEKIAWVDGRGNALTPHTYTYTDENLLAGITYYRFKQLDFDATFSYSNVVNVQYNSTTISIHPNPVKNTLHITDLNGYNVEQINIFDQIGRQVFSTKTSTNIVDVSGLAMGVYIIEIHIQGGILHEKIMVE